MNVCTIFLVIWFILSKQGVQMFGHGCIKPLFIRFDCVIYYHKQKTTCNLHNFIRQRSTRNIWTSELLFNCHYRTQSFSSLFTFLERHLELKNKMHGKPFLCPLVTCFIVNGYWKTLALWPLWCFCLLYCFSTVYERHSSILIVFWRIYCVLLRHAVFIVKKWVGTILFSE